MDILLNGYRPMCVGSDSDVAGFSRRSLLGVVLTTTDLGFAVLDCYRDGNRAASTSVMSLAASWLVISEES